MCLLADYIDLMIYASEVYISALIGQPHISQKPCPWFLLLIAVIVWEYQETGITRGNARAKLVGTLSLVVH